MMFGVALILSVCCATLWSSGSAFKVPAIAADLRNNYAGKNLIFSNVLSPDPEFRATHQCAHNAMYAKDK